ncbi:MAG: NAD(P)/FAD-dependent oxidoreductase [Hyphomicrobiales bacterium]
MDPYDVVVAGGGPGGSTVATLLARRGHRVLLLEREKFPREHIGESLLPATMPILEDLGVMPAVRAAGFVEKWGATMVWGDEAEPWSWYFRETNRRYPHTFQVWRADFDHILLDNTRANGADVREEHTVLEVLFEGERATGVRYRDADGAEAVTQARFVVDASGQGAVLGNRLKVREWDPFFQNLAVYGYFDSRRRLPAPDQGNILVEAVQDGWMWAIPLRDRLSVGVVIDRREGQRLVREQGAEEFLREQISRAPHTGALVGAAAMTAGPYVLKDWSYSSKKVVGDGYILVGDAACFIDPLFSSGVHLAMSAGVLAAAYIQTMFQQPNLAEPAARLYTDLYARQYDHFRQMASLFYSSNRTMDSYFWEARRLFDQDGQFTPRQAFVRAVAGQPPRGYERVVLEHGEAPASFVESVRAVEGERARRSRDVAALQQPDATGFPGIARAVPRLAPGVRVERQLVLGDGEFVWGLVATKEGRDGGTECSPFVAALLREIDGRSNVADISQRLAGERADPRQVFQLAANAVSLLYVDGLVEALDA